MTTIEEDNKKHMERFKYTPPSPSYIAGFIDGDGCIFIRKIKDGYQSGLQISQCRTNVLQIIRYHFGGSITSCENRNNKFENIMNNGHIDKYNIRNQYNLVIRSNEYQLLLDYIKYSFVIKKCQIECLYEFNKVVNLPNKLEEKNLLFEKCRNSNIQTTIETKNLYNINNDYISGLFDAEGCIHIDKNNFSKYYISISQKNHPRILQEIHSLFGFGIVENNVDYVIYKKTDCLKFIRFIRDNLVVKYNQVILFERFLTTNDNDIKYQVYNLCNREKHSIECFSELNQNIYGKERFIETLHWRQIKRSICRQIERIGIYKDKSLKMKGGGNHNYGKSFTQETRDKMSVSIRNSKGGISDDMIVQVRELINNGKSNFEIQTLLSLPRHTVTNIKKRKLICRNEQKTEVITLTAEEVAISKRKIQPDEILIVIEKYIDELSPKQILDYLVDRRLHNDIPNNITIDIIKNIKRKLMLNKKLIYENELSHKRYDYYNKLVCEYRKKQL
jgi:hypothetical protein